jgi:phosphate transport system substrate-binding protein
VNSRKLFAMVVATALLVLGVAACGSDDSTGSDSTGAAPDSSLSGEIAGAGSSAQEAAQEAWIAGIQDASPDVSIAYDPVGSGGGREQFIAGGVDYAGTDSAFEDQELTDAQKRCTDQSGEMIQIPVYISAIAVVYNLPEVDSLQLSPETLAGIFDQKITNWNDPAIAADNPDANLPDKAITPVNRSDDSGTTANFTDYLADTAGKAWPYPADDTWPVKGGEAANGTSGVIDAVTNGDGTIGYADESQAQDLGIAKIKVGNTYVAPSAQGAAADFEQSPKDPSLSQGKNVFAYKVDRTSTDPKNYPILLVSYLMGCTKYDSADTTTLVKEYFNYVISAEGQQVAAQNAGSAPLPPGIVKQIQPAVSAIGS